jgi:3-deoxy-D-manno-octulosonic-acid transferase
LLLHCVVRSRDYLRRWSERFGFQGQARGGSIIVPTVSVGGAILQRADSVLAKRYSKPPYSIVTTFYTTGSDRVRDLFGNEVFHVCRHFDTPGAVKRFYSAFGYLH